MEKQTIPFKDAMECFAPDFLANAIKPKPSDDYAKFIMHHTFGGRRWKVTLELANNG